MDRQTDNVTLLMDVINIYSQLFGTLIVQHSIIYAPHCLLCNNDYDILFYVGEDNEVTMFKFAREGLFVRL